jgi:Family of unknown function (DUF6152)
MVRKMLAAVAAFGAVLAMSSPAIAHHSVTGIFMIDRSATLEGQLISVDWVNPHIYFAVAVKEADGKVTRWRFETLPPGFMRRAGLTKELFADDGGKPVKIVYNPPRDPANKTGYCLEITYADGHSYTLGSLRPPGGGR